jgi:hypothetical protein
MENINPYVFISKKMKVINTSDKPKMSLKRMPPHRASKNILSDLFTLNFMNDSPIKKFIIERNAPSNIDLKIKPDIFEIMKNTVTMSSVRMEITRATIRRCFSFFIISGFQNRLNEGVHSGEDSKK